MNVFFIVTRYEAKFLPGKSREPTGGAGSLRQTCSDCRSGGFTLLEVLLVVGLLVVFGSLAWPALRFTLANQRLRAAAEQIRVEWTRARLAAIKNQTPYIFRYVSGGATYVVEPMTTGSWGSLSTLVSWDQAYPATAGSDRGGELGGFFGSSTGGSATRSLPEGIRFFAGQTALEERAQTILEEWTAATGQFALVQEESVVFFPDGTVTDAEVILENDQGRQINVWVRGLTGVVQVGRVVRGDGSVGWRP